MRVIEVEAEGRSDRWLLWLVAGTAIGLTAGVLVAEKYSGRRPDLRRLGKRLRGMAKLVGAQWGPLVDVALELKDQWDERRAARPAAAHAADEWEDVDGEDLDDDESLDSLEDADEYAEASAPMDADLGDDLDEKDVDAEEESVIASRVLEAFINDPVLAGRAVEIEADDDGDVIIHGTVRSPREVAHAVTIARGVPGVTRVRQRLAVRGRR